ncbi:MAG TPA: adenylate/guanylate cyclase domain-containing protein [Alphaproteobacteria bacterium]|nr:adenylate/guanylate cyclase domain-containing protein [Alphaproteobacteria bacterium]
MRTFYAWIWIILVSTAAGVAYHFLLARESVIFVSAIFGLVTGVPIFAFVRGMLLPRLNAWLRSLAFPIYAPTAICLCVASILVSNFAAGTLFWSLGIIRGSFGEAALATPEVIAYSLAMSAALTFFVRMTDLIGHDILVDLLIGRYHRPVREDRVFLFIDVAGSTRFAEKFGDLRAQEYLGAFFATVSESVHRFRGRIDDYVGDLAIVSWPIQAGVADANCIRCVFAIRVQIADQAAYWRKHFETVPHFRAALHCGPIVTAEVGIDKHKIAYFGDTINATARLEGLCRELDQDFLASTDILARVSQLPEGVSARDFGSHTVHGRQRALAIHAMAGPVIATGAS